MLRAAGGGVAADAPRVVAFEERWRPVAHWTRAARATCAGTSTPSRCPSPRRATRGSLVSLVARATNTGAATAEATLEIALEPPDPVPIVRRLRRAGAARAHALGPRRAAPTPPRPGRRCRSRARASPCAGRSRPARDARAAHRAAGLSDAGRGPRGMGRVPHAADLGRASADRHWDEALARGTRFELGDPEVESRAARRASSCCSRAASGAARCWVPIGGAVPLPRRVAARRRARGRRRSRLRGTRGEARELAAGLALFQWPEGAFVSQRGQLDGTGQALWAFEQALLRPAAGRLGRCASPRRRAAPGPGSSGSAASAARRAGRSAMMLPFGDPRDDELVRAQLVGNDAWALAGYRAAARLLRAAGRDAEADTVEASRARLRRRLRDRRWRGAAAATSRPRGRAWAATGATSRSAGRARRSRPTIRGSHALADRVWAEAGGARALHLRPPRLAARLRRRRPRRSGRCSPGARADADSVLAAMLALAQRRAAARLRAVLALEPRLRRATCRRTPTTAAALVSLVRNALVYDDDDTLRLTLGARDAWWRGAARARRADPLGRDRPRASRRDGDAAVWSWSPVPVWTELTLPARTRPGRPAAGAAAGRPRARTGCWRRPARAARG